MPAVRQEFCWIASFDIGIFSLLVVPGWLHSSHGGRLLSPHWRDL